MYHTPAVAASTDASQAQAPTDAAAGARDAAHAENAAAAAEWAVQYAGQAVDHANKSTEFANQASKAADAASAAVAEAVAVEKAAREAEWQRLDLDTAQAIEESRLLAQLEQRDREASAAKATEAERTQQATRDLIAQAETALRSGDSAAAATLGRKAAVAVIGGPAGSWTSQAARFALSGADADVHVWVDTDRRLAQRQDDRETSLYLAQVSPPDIGFAAAEALESSDPEAVGAFLGGGIVQAAVTESRVMVARALADNPGKALTQAAYEALDADTPEALHRFLTVTGEAAQQEDDGVATARLLAVESSGPYTRAHAKAAMEGPAWMRRGFLASGQYRTAQLDYDSASHIAAMQGAIAAAAKIANKAQEDAARAQEAAATARDAAAEAVEWASRAQNWAADALKSAQQANTHAESADQHAKDAQLSAEKAAQAATTARLAARSANYSANRAFDAARGAVASANGAQMAAASARSSAVQAGQDAKVAAVAASQAHHIVAAKRAQELAVAARHAAEEARDTKASGVIPANTPEHDAVKGGVPCWNGDPGWMANATSTLSTITGYMAIAALAGARMNWRLAPVLGPWAFNLATLSTIYSGISTVFVGINCGRSSGEFKASLATTAAKGLGLGVSQLRKPLEAAGRVAEPVISRITGASYYISPVTAILTAFR
ncbi:ALF repeat-containing protein [Streptomyces sp. NPDC059762]|uniref:ALF repeat-containing protein n=1 Tax=Streptomyces sp. NPDC059762 TaxID=3346938 RepID=UPI0036482411